MINNSQELSSKYINFDDKLVNDVKFLENEIKNSINLKEELKLDYIKQAELINFKNISDELFDTDEFGNIKNNNVNNKSVKIYNISEEENCKIKLRENARTEKWNKMLKDFDSFYKNNFNKLKTRTRNGIPDCIRGFIWQKLGKIKNLKSSYDHILATIIEKNKVKINVLDENNSTNNIRSSNSSIIASNISIYSFLLNSNETFEFSLENIKDKNNLNIFNNQNVNEIEKVILRDINRTFPHNLLFKEKYGEGQRKLFNILRAYALFNPYTGYVQGMGFIAALFLTYMSEENVFWMIHTLLVNYNLQGYYETNFPLLPVSFYVLLSLMKKHLNKIYNLFKSKEVYPSMYGSQWFITIFSNCFYFKILVKVFDCFLLEGEKIIYRLALSLLKVNESKFLNAKSFEDILYIFKTLYKDLDEHTLFKTAFDFSIRRSDIKKLKDEFKEIKSNDLLKEKDEIYIQSIY